jgi:signal transduction histidine kinase
VSGSSLRLRLLLGSVVWIVVALMLAGLALERVYARQALERYDEECRHYLDLVSSRAEIGPDGAPRFSEPLNDPRALRPYGGLYAQIATQDQRVARSRSLWDARLPVPVDLVPAGRERARTVDVAGPGRLRLVERSLLLPGSAAPVFVQAAIPMAEITADAARFRKTLAVSLAALALCLIAAAAVQVAVGLKPLAQLRGALAELRAGRRQHLATAVPQEVEPLVHDLNALLDDNRAMIEAARAEAADLAHALKTPLTVLEQEARALIERGDAELGGLLVDQTERMRRQVDHHLARARAVAAAHERTEPVPVAEVVAGIARVVERLRDVRVDAEIAPAHRFRGARQDLEEMLGNLMENAAKWAGGRIRVGSTLAAGELVLTVEDDGPGLDAAAREAVVERGRRLDERAPGSGLGLAIVRDLASAYAGRLELDRSALGGLAARLVLPAAGASP